MELEERTQVILYEVHSYGWSTEHDSPYLGVSTNYGSWNEKHGIYCSQELADIKRNAIVETYLGERGYSRSVDNPEEHLFDSGSGEVFVTAKPREVDKRDIATDGHGQRYYDGEKILDTDESTKVCSVAGQGA